MKESENNQLAAYLSGDLSEADQRELDQRIRQSPVLQEELADLKRVLGLWDHAPEVEPSAYSRDQFHQFLAVEARQHAPSATESSSRLSWWAAAAVALLVIGIGFGVVVQNHRQQQLQIQQLSAEVVETRKLLLLAMLDDPSASERIKAMNVSTRDIEQDQRIVTALIDRLNNDENDNVRLKAAESLSKFIHVGGVAEAVIQALELERSPEVQIMLIESLVNEHRKEAVPSLRRLMDREDVPKVVRDLAAFGLETMI